MTKSGLIERVAALTPHISKKDTEVVVNTIFDAMTDALKAGERIEIRGFGSFQGRSGRRGRAATRRRASRSTSRPSARPSSRWARS
jgi:integration host factor subunit beta